MSSNCGASPTKRSTSALTAASSASGLASGWSLAASARAAAYVSAYAATGRGAQASYGTPAQIRARFEA